MALLLACPHCNRKLSVPEHGIGKLIRCPLCASSFQAPPNVLPVLDVEAEPRSASPVHDPFAITSKLPPPARPFEMAPSRDADSDRARGTASRASAGDASSRRVLPSLEFRVLIRNDTRKLLKGYFQGQLTPDGLFLKQGKKHSLQLRPAIFARYLGGNRVQVDVDGRHVELRIVRWRIYQHRLAEDIAAFLKGRVPYLHAEDYYLPWYLFAPAVLPLGIPIVTLGGAIPTAIGFGLAGACIAIAQQETLPALGRMAASLALSIAGYVGLVVFLLMIGAGIPGDNKVGDLARQGQKVDPPQFQPPPPPPVHRPPPEPVIPPAPHPLPEEPKPPPEPKLHATGPDKNGSYHLGREQNTSIAALAFATDGKSLLSVTAQGKLRRWSLSPMELQSTLVLKNRLDPQGSHVFSPDRTMLVSSTTDGWITLFDTKTGEVIANFNHNPAIRTRCLVAMSPDGRRLAYLHDAVRVWDAAEKKIVWTSGEVQEHWLGSIAFSTDGKTLAATTGALTIKLWEADTGNELATLRGEMKEGRPSMSERILALEGKTLVTGGSDGNLRFWDTDARQVRSIVRGGGSYPVATFSKQRNLLAVAGGDQRLRFLDLEHGIERAVRTCGWENHPMKLEFSPHGEFLAMSLYGGVHILDVSRITLKDLEAERKSQPLPAPEGRVVLQGDSKSLFTGLGYSPDGSSLLAYCGTGKLIRWNTVPPKHEATIDFKFPFKYVGAVSLSRDHKLLATGWPFGQIVLVELPSGERHVLRKGREVEWAPMVVLSPDGTRLASIHMDRSAFVWDVTARKMLWPLPEHRSNVGAIAFNPDGKTLVAGDTFGSVSLRDASTGQRLLNLEMDRIGNIKSMEFSVDGKVLAVCAGSKVCVFDMAERKQLAVLRHKEKVTALTFLRDGRRLAVGCDDGTLYFWEAEAEMRRAFYQLEDRSPVRALAFSARDNTLAVATGKTVQLWDVSKMKRHYH